MLMGAAESVREPRVGRLRSRPKQPTLDQAGGSLCARAGRARGGKPWPRGPVAGKD